MSPWHFEHAPPDGVDTDRRRVLVSSMFHPVGIGNVDDFEGVVGHER